MYATPETTELAILTNFIPPTRLPAFLYLSRRLRTTIFTDTEMEDNRKWPVQNKDLTVRVIRGFSTPVSYAHPQGFRETSYLHLPFGLLGYLLKAKPERILSGELGFRTGVACLYKALRPKTQLVVWSEGTPHTDGPRGRLRRWWRRALIRIPDRFLAVSSGARDLLLSYGAQDGRVQVSLFVSGFNPPPHIPRRDSAQRQRILHCGSLKALKGIRPFVEALLSVLPALDRPTELWFAGDGPEESFLRSLSLPPNLSFRFLGFVPFERMPEVYRQCGILVFPTLADVWGLVTNEAMMHGMPVLGSRYAQSVCDLVTNGETGWTFLPDDRADMERAIRAALSAETADLEQMGAAARRRVQNLTPESFAIDLLTAFHIDTPEPVR